MGAVAFTVAGQVIGSYFGGPVGAAIGGAIGSAVGGALFPEQLPQIEGPKLDEKNIQVSTYGKAIPIAFGVVRMAGNVIWASELRETRSEVEQGGKGGGPVQTTVSYTYDADVAIGIAEGEVMGIRRIWINGVLVYDARSIDDPAVQATYGDNADEVLRAIKASGAGSDSFVFYPGDETQLPDPTIEALEGAGNVPAYRGLSYVVFPAFQLARWGNRIPQFEFEIVTEGTSTYGQRVADEFHAAPHYRSHDGGTNYTQAAYQPIVSSMADGIRVFSANSEFVDPNVRVYGFDGSYIQADTLTDWEGGFGIVQIGQVEPQVWVLFDGAILKFDITATLDYQLEIVGVPSMISINELLGVPIGGCAPCADGRHFMVFEFDDSGSPYNVTNWHIVEYLGMNDARLVDSGTVDMSTDASMTLLNVGLGPIHTANGHWQVVMMERDLRHVWRSSGVNIQLWTIDDDGELALDLSSSAADWPVLTDLQSDTPITMHCDNGFAFFIGGDEPSGHRVYVYTRLPAITATPIVLGDVVAALCERVGLQPSQIDVDDLTTIVRGFIIQTSMTARAAIEALMRAYNFDAAESGDQLLFKLRGTESALTLTEDDLGASDGGKAAVLVASDRAQENELPAEVSVAYMDYGADFQRGAQAVRRMATQSIEKVDLALPVVLTADEAAQAAEMLMYQSWVGRNVRQFATTRAFSQLEPTDVVTIQAEGLEATVRLISRRQSDGLIEWTGTDVDSSTFDPNSVGASLPLPPGIRILAPSRVIVLDIPALREQDDDAGVYIAVYPSGAGAWAGAAILSSSSPSGPFARVSSAYAAATVGIATTVIGAYAGGNTFDELNSVNVRMFSGAPESSTRDAVLNGANVAVLGSEIIQWTTATDLGDDVYELTGLLRGRRATEQFIGAGHALNERFVVLNTSLVRLPLGTGVIGSNLIYRAVTFGAAEQDSVFDDALRHIGASAIPALVANITGVRTDAGVLFRWNRRDRLAWEWADYIDLPMSEDLERYTIEIYTTSAGVPIRIVNDITTNEYLYTAAQESEDFEAIEAGDFPLAVRVLYVYQMSQQAGRGFSRETTVTGLLNF